jgi:hypothetical protein
MPKAKVQCLIYFMLRPLIVHLPAFLVLSLWFLWQLYCSMEPAFGENEVAFWAHVGGFAAGTVVATMLYGVLQHQSQKGERQASQVLADTWNAYLTGRVSEAAGLHEQFIESMQDTYRAKQPLIAGLLRLQTDNDKGEAASAFFQALQRAMNNLDPSQALTAYLQIRKHIPNNMIPAHVHRDGAGAALTCHQPFIGLRGITLALEAGLDEGTSRILERAEAVLRKTLQLPDAADRVHHLRTTHLASEHREASTA